MPTRIASWLARSRCPRSRAAGPVIQRLSPDAVAMRPSRLVASFSVTSGRPSRTRLEEPGIDLGRLRLAEPDIDRQPGLAQPRHAAAGDPRVGVLDRDHHPRAPRRRSARRRRAACGPSGSTVRASHRRWRPGRRAGPGQAPRSRHAAGRPAGSSRGRPPALLDDDAADRRVRPDIAEPAPRQRQARAHEAAIGASCDERRDRGSAHREIARARSACRDVQSPSAAMRPTNSPKSLASRKLR